MTTRVKQKATKSLKVQYGQPSRRPSPKSHVITRTLVLRSTVWPHTRTHTGPSTIALRIWSQADAKKEHEHLQSTGQVD